MDDFVPLGTFGNNWRHFWLSQLGEWGCYWHSWIEDRDTAKHPTIHRTAATIKTYLALDINVQRLRNSEIK